jgi:hypothetical protein
MRHPYERPFRLNNSPTSLKRHRQPARMNPDFLIFRQILNLAESTRINDLRRLLASYQLRRDGYPVKRIIKPRNYM